MSEESGALESLLGELGFTVYQKRAYQALASVNRLATAADIAKRSGIPLPKVYETMASLEKANLVTSTAVRPKRYSLALPTPLQKRIETEQERLKSYTETLSALSQHLSTQPEEQENIVLLQGRENVLDRLAYMLQHTVERSYDMILPLSHTYPELAQPVRDALGRGVAIRIIGHTEGQLGIAANYLRSGIQVRLFKDLTLPNPIRLVVADERECTFIITGANKNYLTIFTNSPPITQSIHTIFKAHWNAGADLRQIVQSFAPSVLVGDASTPFTPAQRFLLDIIGQCPDQPKSFMLPHLTKPLIIHPGTYNPAISNVAALLAGTLSVERGESALSMGGAADYFGIRALLAGAGHATLQCPDVESASAARKNAKAFGLKHAVVKEGMLFEGMANKRFDHIIFNPPFIDDKPRTPLEACLFDDSRKRIRLFMNHARSHLKPAGKIHLAYTDGQDAKGETGTALLYRLCSENDWNIQALANVKRHGETYTSYLLTRRT